MGREHERNSLDWFHWWGYEPLSKDIGHDHPRWSSFRLLVVYRALIERNRAAVRAKRKRRPPHQRPLGT